MTTAADASATGPWPPARPPEPTYVDDRLNYWAEATPDGEAITYLGRTWTWAQLHERVHRAAGGLRELGVARGDVVAFVGSDHPACAEVTMAAGSIGAANAAIDETLTGDEIADAVAGSGADVLFVSAALMPTVEAVRERIAVRTTVPVGPDGPGADAYEAFLRTSFASDDGPDVLEDDVCLIRYTSAAPERLTHQDLVARSIDADDVHGRIHDGVPTVIGEPR